MPSAATEAKAAAMGNAVDVWRFIAASRLHTNKREKGGGAVKPFDYTGNRWQRKRAQILRRDGYQCVWCRRYGRSRQASVVHHIKHADEFPELAYQDSNLVSLCQSCHNKAHPEKARAATAGRLR